MTRSRPRLQRPEQMPPITTAADLYDRWTALMGPLGFGRRRLWLAFFASDGRMTPALTEIDEIPPRTDAEGCRPLLGVCAHLLDSIPGGSVAMLYTRPGRHPMSADDRSWGRGLSAAARRQGVFMWPVHFANDEVLQVFAPDDLAVPLAG